jgi:hypothetical protein
MRVAGDHDVNATAGWIDLQFLQVVQDIKGTLAEPDHLRVGIFFRPVASIDVSSDRSEGRNPAEPYQDVRAADIAGVDDMRHAGKPLRSLGPQQPMGIRNDSNPQHWPYPSRSNAVPDYLPRLTARPSPEVSAPLPVADVRSLSDCGESAGNCGASIVHCHRKSVGRQAPWRSSQELRRLRFPS